MGEGWTGALGSGRLDQVVPGHHDYDAPSSYSFNNDAPEVSTPLLVYRCPHRIHACSVGWGHSALLHPPNSSTSEQQEQLLLTGRPHEVSALLRLSRLPAWLRQRAVVATYQSIVHARDTRSLTPTDLVGRIITYLSDVFLSSSDWEVARRQSSMVHWTPLERQSQQPTEHHSSMELNRKDTTIEKRSADSVDEALVDVQCSAGLTALLTESGKLYTFGLNGMGQCGVGSTSNNVWTPTPVVMQPSQGEKVGDDADDAPHHPITQVALGFQRR